MIYYNTDSVRQEMFKFRYIRQGEIDSNKINAKRFDSIELASGT
jgi:hypothetical protein